MSRPLRRRDEVTLDARNVGDSYVGRDLPKLGAAERQSRGSDNRPSKLCFVGDLASHPKMA